jgi:SAM-dependent methyltransferase
MKYLRALPQWRIFAIITLTSFVFLYFIGTNFSSRIATISIPFLAFGLAIFLHDGSWWKWIHLFFLPTILIFVQLNIAPQWYLLALLICWLVFGRVMVSRVPLYLSNREALLQLGSAIPPSAKFLDIGAGTGTVLNYLARQRPDLSLIGVEQAKAPWLLGKLRLPRNVTWLNADYESLDLSAYDCVYAFLSPAVMSKLWQQASSQMRPGSMLISNTFVVPGVSPDQIIELNDWKDGKLLLWRM